MRARTGSTAVSRAAAEPRAVEVTAVLPEPRAAEAPRAAESACEAHASGAALQAQARSAHLRATEGDQDGEENGDALRAHRAHRARSHGGSGLQSTEAGQEEARAGMAKNL